MEKSDDKSGILIQGIKIGIDARFIQRPMRGMPMYTYMLCQLLPKALPNVHFYLFINSAFKHNDKQDNYQSRLEEIKRHLNVTIVDIPSSGEFIWEQWKLPKLLKKYQINLLHMPGNRVCFFLGTKQISTIHDAMEWKKLNIFKGFNLAKAFREKFYTIRIRAYLWLLYRLGLKRANHILTISQYAQDSILASFPFLSQKISYTYHGIPPLYADNFREEAFLSKRKGVLMLGGDSFQKNPVNMIQAWNLLSGDLKNKHPLTVAGFTGNHNSPISLKLAELNNPKNIHIKGWISDFELVELFQQHRVFIFASREEGFGFPLLQSMRIGTPVVTSKAEVLAEIGSDAVFSADAENPQKLSEKLAQVLEDDELWQDCRKRGIERAKEFNWDKTAQDIATLYINVISS